MDKTRVHCTWGRSFRNVQPEKGYNIHGLVCAYIHMEGIKWKQIKLG